MSTYSLSLAQTTKNLPHIVSNLNALDPQPLANGLYRFMNRAQANNVPAMHKYHLIQPITTVNASAFQTAGNGYIDYNLPMNIDILDDMVLEILLANAHGSTAWVADASLPWFFQRIEIRHDGQILQTLRDLHLYLDNTMFQDDFERNKLQYMTGIDPATYQVDQSILTVPASSSATFRLRLPSVLTKCGIYIKSLQGQLVIRVYPQSIATFSGSTINSSISLSQATLLISEGQYTPDAETKLDNITSKPVDYRFIDVIHEETTLSLTSNAVTKYITNNFHNPVYAFVAILVRANNPTLGDLEKFIQQNNVWLEDVSNMNLSNGIQWADDELRKYVYPANFPNTMAMQSNMFIYIPKAPSLNPEVAYKRGINNGFDVLPKNCKVCINPASTATYHLDILCYTYVHVRVEGGKIKIYI